MLVIRESTKPPKESGSTGESLADMALWSFGLPFAETLPNGQVIVLYSPGAPEGLQVELVRLALD